jgi:hypothetical protein
MNLASHCPQRRIGITEDSRSPLGDVQAIPRSAAHRGLSAADHRVGPQDPPAPNITPDPFAARHYIEEK